MKYTNEITNRQNEKDISAMCPICYSYEKIGEVDLKLQINLSESMTPDMVNISRLGLVNSDTDHATAHLCSFTAGCRHMADGIIVDSAIAKTVSAYNRGHVYTHACCIGHTKTDVPYISIYFAEFYFTALYYYGVIPEPILNIPDTPIRKLAIRNDHRPLSFILKVNHIDVEFTVIGCYPEFQTLGIYIQTPDCTPEQINDTFMQVLNMIRKAVDDMVEDKDPPKFIHDIVNYYVHICEIQKLTLYDIIAAKRIVIARNAMTSTQGKFLRWISEFTNTVKNDMSLVYRDTVRFFEEYTNIHLDNSAICKDTLDIADTPKDQSPSTPSSSR